MKKLSIKISGMHCASCSKMIELELEGKVISSDINHETGRAIIEFEEKKISQKQIIELITKAGYKIG